MSVEIVFLVHESVFSRLDCFNVPIITIADVMSVDVVVVPISKLLRARFCYFDGIRDLE